MISSQVGGNMLGVTTGMAYGAGKERFGGPQSSSLFVLGTAIRVTPSPRGDRRCTQDSLQTQEAELTRVEMHRKWQRWALLILRAARSKFRATKAI